MKIAIHHKRIGFSKYWLDYCAEQKIDTKLVNCYYTDIIQELEDCDALMWHFHHANYKDVLFAKQLMYSLETSGKVVFPDFKTVWFFDDKLGQKYLLESVNAPSVPSYVFYEKHKALKWVNSTNFPKVFKLRTGAGSEHVKRVDNRKEAKKLVQKAFGHGFQQYEALYKLKERWRKYRNRQTNFLDVLKGVARLGYSTEFNKVAGRERGYVLFQDFIPGNDFDLRVIVIDEKAFAIKRHNRKNDFRASGSGFNEYGKEHFNEEIIEKSFELTEKLESKSLSIDYVYDNGLPLIVEVNFGYSKNVYDKCEGYWDRDLNWTEGTIHPEQWMVDTVIKQIEQMKTSSKSLDY